MRPTLMLTLVTIYWGLSFPLMKMWQDEAASCPGGAGLASFTLIGVRYALAFLVLAVYRPWLIVGPTQREYFLGSIFGFSYFVGSTLQVIGLLWTTPALSGFITSLNSAWVPILALWWFRTRLPALTLSGLLLGIAGVVVLTNINSLKGSELGGGVGLTLIGSVIFAVQILQLDRWGRQVKGEHFTAALIGVTAVGGLAIAMIWAAVGPGWGPWLEWTWDKLRRVDLLIALVVLVVVCTVLAFHAMNRYQPQVSAHSAALIYLLEPVFAAIFSVSFGIEPITIFLLAGGGLVILGNLIADAPRWRKTE